MSRWLVAAGACVAVLAAIDLGRAGYSPDEEFTIYAVRGIQAHGLPLLPSGLLYDRGLLYSYAVAPLIGSGGELWPARLVSLAASLAALAVVAVELRRWAAPGAAALAVLAAGASLPFWVSATTARFYAPFLFGYLGVLAIASRVSTSWRALAGLALAAAATRWTHELAFTLVGPPLIAALTTRAGERRGWLARTVAIAAGLAAGQAAILAVHALAPPSNGDVMVRRFFVWQVLNLLERPPLDLVAALPATAGLGVATALGLAALRARVDVPGALLVGIGGVAAALGQIGVAPMLVLAALPLAPSTARRLVPTALAVLCAGLTYWVVALVIAGRPPVDAADLTVGAGTVYPLDMFAYMLRETPLMVAAVLAGLLARVAGLGGSWPAQHRALHALWIGWVLWFGVIESGITARYLLLPVTFMLTALAVDLSAIVTATAQPARRVPAVLGALAVVVVTLEGWGGVPTGTSRAAAARPTLVLDGLRADLQADDLVVGHDELATLSAAGHIDAWLGLDPFYRERFVVMRGAQPTGTYTGAPAAFELAPLLERATRDGRRLMVVDVLKDMPGFGSTSQLVPRQLAREDLRADVVAEVPGARLLQIRPDRPETLAAR